MGKRYINDMNLNMDPAYVENSIQAYLSANDFKSVCEKGEYFYKAGGIMTSLRGFKYWYVNGILHIEAWIGKVGKEMNIGDGKLFGAAAKIPYYNSILALLEAFEKERQQYTQQPGMQQPYPRQPYVQQANPNQQMQQTYPEQPYPQQPGMQQQYPQRPYVQQTNPNQQMQQTYSQQQYTQQPYPQMQQPVNSALTHELNKANDKNAVIAFWLSIASLVLIFGSRFSLLLNLFSYSLAISNGLKSRKKGMAIAAIVINSIVIVITLLLIFL